MRFEGLRVRALALGFIAPKAAQSGFREVEEEAMAPRTQPCGL